jgi:site-specific recombinase XerD
VDTSPALPEPLAAPNAFAPAANPVVAYLAGLGPGSRRTQAKALHTVCRIIGGADVDLAGFPWSRITFAHSAALRQELATRYAPATANRLLAAWRGALRAAWRLGQLPEAAYLRAVDVKDLRLSGMLRGRVLGTDERRRLFAHAVNDPRPVGRRDAAMLVLLYGCGLRREEAASLATHEITPEGIRVVGKGGKWRLVPVPPAYAALLDAYRATLGHGPLLRAIHPRTQEITPRGITPSGVRKALIARLRAAGCATATPHDLRRSYITDLLSADVDLLTVASLAGHTRIDTTRKYDHRPHAARIAAVAVLGTEGE